MAGPISPPPVRRWDPEYIPAYVSNGLIGARVGHCPLVEGVTIVSGLAAVQPLYKVEGFARGPYPFAGDVAVDGVQLSKRPDAMRFVSQEYDFSRGELHTSLRLVTDGATAEIEILTFCSRTRPTCVAQETRVRVDRACDLTLTAKLDPTGIDGTWLSREVGDPSSEKQNVDGALLWEPPGALTKCGGAYWTELLGAPNARVTRDVHTARAPLSTSYQLRARSGRWYVLRQIASLIPSDFHKEPNRQAVRMTSVAAQEGFDKLRADNAAEWAELWRGRVVLLGADRKWQALADAAFYYLHAGAHRSSLFSTSMFGLAYWPNYHYYRGQVMWDIEFFAHPMLALTQPDAAHALLQYRFDHLDAAERNAAMNGHFGAQFPWASTTMNGEEGIRTSAPLVLFEQHVSLCVALAFARQVHLTGDIDYLHRRAWPVIEGVAGWIESRWKRTDRGLELLGTLGIAEQRAHPVDNPAYVNAAAIAVLKEAAAFAEQLGRDGAKWRRMAEEIRIPMDEQRRVLKNHERFTARATGRSAATPEALAALWPVGYALDEEAERETIQFYLDRVDPYLGSPMLPPILGVFAARIGDRARAQKLFEQGYAEYVNEAPFRETDEFSRTRSPQHPRTGPFTANLGGFLMACALGLTGLQIRGSDPRSWPVRAPAMPSGWDGVEIERIFVGGRDAHLIARQGDERARIT